MLIFKWLPSIPESFAECDEYGHPNDDEVEKALEAELAR